MTKSNQHIQIPHGHSSRDPHLWVEIAIILILLLSLSLLFAKGVY